jgi:hypothetical protein
MRWAADRFAGRPTSKGCKTMEMSEESVRAAREGVTFAGLLGVGLAFLGLPIGPTTFQSWATKMSDDWPTA